MLSSHFIVLVCKTGACLMFADLKKDFQSRAAGRKAQAAVRWGGQGLPGHPGAVVLRRG